MVWLNGMYGATAGNTHRKHAASTASASTTSVTTRTAVGLGWSVQTQDSVEFPAYSGSVDFQYASPLK